MNDYRNRMCLLDGQYLARCVAQDFIFQVLTFEVCPDGDTFTRQGEHGVERYDEQELTFEDVKSRLPILHKGDIYYVK